MDPQTQEKRSLQLVLHRGVDAIELCRPFIQCSVLAGSLDKIVADLQQVVDLQCFTWEGVEISGC